MRRTTSYKIADTTRAAAKDFCAYNGRELGHFVDEAIREKLEREWNLTQPMPMTRADEPGANRNPT